MTGLSGADWDTLIADLPNAHVLQSWEWGQFKALTGWRPLPQVWHDPQGRVRAAALVLRRAVPGGLSVLYVPRGPLVDWQDKAWSRRVIADLRRLATRQGAIFIKIDPELVLGTGIPGTDGDYPNPEGERLLAEMRESGWRFSTEQVQFRNTVWLDLSGSEGDWLARMKQKTRYNLRLSQRKGVKVRSGTEADLDLLYRMYAETSIRDGFVIRGAEYYQTLWKTFMARGMAEPLIAEFDGETIAAIFVFYFDRRAWYFYGMSREQHREVMPNYLLQWEAMRRAKAHGCLQYDLWGAPDAFDESDPMWGVFRFKEGLGGTVVRTAGAWDFPSRPLLYVLYTRILPGILSVMRRRGRVETRQAVGM